MGATQPRRPSVITAPACSPPLLVMSGPPDPRVTTLHRVVVYRGDKEEADQVVPFSALESSDPERLWDWMEAYEAEHRWPGAGHCA